MTMTTTAASLGLTTDALDSLGQELDSLRADVMGQLGSDDVCYIRRVIGVQRWSRLVGRASLYLGFLPPFWLLGTGALGLSKILDNMEIGHNVLHGQYDWTGDEQLSSSSFDWDSPCPPEGWKRYHNFVHHTFTNITGKDRDLGYGVLRISGQTPWKPANLGNPLYAAGLALAFDHGIMLHDVDMGQVRRGERTRDDAKRSLRNGLRKAGRLAFRDYVLWPALTGPLFLTTLAANAVANVIRNVWSFIIIFCGHFPSGTVEFSEEECENESRGHWYLRQILGSANISGGRLFHIMSGNLSFQIEHHLFPDLPSRRYQQIAPQVREICTRYGIPYTTGRLSRQFLSVVGKILRHAFPSRPRVPMPQCAPEPAELMAA